MAQRVAQRPDLIALRKTIVEHPFGTIKRAMNQGYLLLKRLPNVTAEISLTVLSYNLNRVMNILGVQNLMKALQPA